MPAENLIALPNEPASVPCKKAFWILTAAHRTVSELLSLFDSPGGSPRPQGNPSHADQDILRSMIVFAGAGLDSSVKQLVKDAYARLIERDNEVQKKGIEHLSKQIGRSDSSQAKDLVRWLFHTDPRSAMTADLIKELTSDSLQSKDQIYKIAEYLGISKVAVVSMGDSELKNAFDVRNKIIHELDVDFTKTPLQGQRKRTSRRRNDMVKHANMMLSVAFNFVAQVDSKIA